MGKATRWKTFQLSCTSSSIYASFSGSFQFSSVAQSCPNLRDPMAVFSQVASWKNAWDLVKSGFPLLLGHPNIWKADFQGHSDSVLRKCPMKTESAQGLLASLIVFDGSISENPEGFLVCLFVFFLFCFVLFFGCLLLAFPSDTLKFRHELTS